MAKEKWDYERVMTIFSDCIDWLSPLIKTKRVNGQKVTYDAHAKNYLSDEYLISRGLYRNILIQVLNLHPELHEAYGDVLQVEEMKLMKAGLHDYTNANFTDKVLNNRHNKYWSNKQTLEQTHQVKDFNISDLLGFDD